MEIETQQLTKRTFPVTGMTCAACASSVETILQYTDGVKSANVNFATNTVQVEFTEETDTEKLNQALTAIGYGLIISNENISKVVAEAQAEEYQLIKSRTIWSVILTLPVVVIGMFFMDWEMGRWISLILTIPVLFYFGQPFFIGAWKQAKFHKANMDTLVALSTGIAFL